MKSIFLFVTILSTSLSLFAINEYAITTTNINLRQNNSVNSQSLKVIEKGDTLEILTENQEWSKVLYENYEGYVSSRYLTKIVVNNTGNKSSKKETFKDQKGFTAGFKFIFLRFFIFLFIIAGSILTYSLRKKDGRFKKGYREGQMSYLSLIKLAIYTGAVSLIAGFIGGIISLFH